MNDNIELFYSEDGYRGASLKGLTVADLDGISIRRLETMEFIDCIIEVDLADLELEELVFENCEFKVEVKTNVFNQTFKGCNGIAPSVYNYTNMLVFEECNFSDLPKVIVDLSKPTRINVTVDDLSLVTNFPAIERLAYNGEVFKDTISCTKIVSLGLYVESIEVEDLSYLKTLKSIGIYSTGESSVKLPKLPKTIESIILNGLVDHNNNVPTTDDKIRLIYNVDNNKWN